MLPLRSLVPCLALAVAAACSRGSDDKARPPEGKAGPAAAVQPAREIVVYSGRSEALVGPILARFEARHGIAVKVKYGDTAALAALLLEEGSRTPAAAYFAQDVGAAGALARRGLLAALPADLLDRVAARHRAPDGTWVGITGRARTLVYNPTRVTEAELPRSITELTGPRWRGKVGWAPSNASFQVFVTGLRLTLGEDGAEAWLRAMKDNQPREYPKNGPIVQAVAAGAVDIGLVNHYYLLQLQRDDPGLTARNHYTQARDPGSVLSLAAFAIPKSAAAADALAAQTLARYLLSDEVQAAFAAETAEYPLVAGVAAPPGLRPLTELEPAVDDLGALHDLEGTLALLRKTGILP